ncbi:hypothetical protein A4G21_04700 [Brucella intermedia]|nr:hypothetical protein A4G21_04700 [Brucella intermedia]
MKKGKRPQFRKSLLLHSRYSESLLASGLYIDRKKRWVPILKRRPDDRFAQLELKNFSFVDHPEHTLRLFQSILEFEGQAIEAQLHFDDEYCQDVAAYLVLAEMWPAMARVFRNGRMSHSIQKVLETLNLRDDLSMRLLGLKDTKDIWAFPKRTRRPAGSSQGKNRDLLPQPREKVADEFVQALDDWLGVCTDEFALTKHAKAHFASIIGELLDNAERHSSAPSKDGGWSTAAFLVKRREGDKDVFRCYMGFLSVGASISDSMGYASVRMRAKVNQYLDRHRNSGISRETLRTVVAMQDGVTRDNDAEFHQRGGVGLQEVLDLVNALGYTSDAENGPRLTIVSGRSCIKARYPYIFGRHTEGKGMRTLWFNRENDPMEPPDREFVFDLENNFPGTIIGITFVFSKDDLKAAIDANKSE